MPLFAKVGQTLTFLCLLTGTLRGQSAADLTQVLQRLDRLEKENRTLAEEIQSLRTQLQAAGLAAQPEAPPIAERLEVAERRIEEQAQTKVEASQKLPLTLEGMVLMNTFWNTRDTAGAQNPTLLPSSTEGLPRTYGATLRQSLVGLRYRGPTLAGARLTGAISLDLYGGTTQALNHLVRLRTATVELNWGKRYLLVGQDKPLISERNPASLAQVGVVPLTNAGNIWLWQPQVRFGQEFALTPNSTLKAHVAMHQTREESTDVPELFAASFARARPGLQGRVEFSHRWSDRQSIAIAPGFHVSNSRVAGTSVPSRIASFDWLVAPSERWEWTGLFYTGSNIAHMGTLRQGFVILQPGQVLPVRGLGGWSQLAYRPFSWVSFHVYAGQHDDKRRDLRFGGTDKNQAYGTNLIFKLSQNVLLGLEASQVRTTYTNTGTRRNTHYDVSVGYLF